ncbi:bactofilin family protein [Alteripontixanthobacter maritimus]|nr:polymer-forming cytoskeletal protein [Alteripontixanthobacter maritimus]
MAKGNSTFSVIGTDVTIKGDISASVDLHVDGRVDGDIACASLVQGEESVIEGAVKAESARLAGTVSGSINARELTILRTAKIDGDVHYDALTIEQGAQVEGRLAFRSGGGTGLASSKPIANGAAADAAANANSDPKLALAT